MKVVNVFDAKTHFSNLIDQVYQQRESIIITRRGIQVASIVPIEEQQKQNVITLLHELDTLSEEIGKAGIGLKEIKKMKEEGRR
jgi:prevent-host-death family protein